MVGTDILDGRAELPADSLDERGFTLMRHESAVADWYDEAHLDEVYRPEMRALASEVSGADHVIAYPALVRSPQEAAATPDYAPIEFVHSDFTEDYRAMATSPDRPYRRFVEPILAEHGLDLDLLGRASRLELLQFWRNTGPLNADRPLAVCDARDMARERCLPFLVPEYGGQPLAFETFAFAPPSEDRPDHWYTFPAMASDEVLVFRTYDSQRADDGRPFWTPHTAFRDPNVAGAAGHERTSVELRTLCIWL